MFFQVELMSLQGSKGTHQDPLSALPYLLLCEGSVCLLCSLCLVRQQEGAEPHMTLYLLVP